MNELFLRLLCVFIFSVETTRGDDASRKVPDWISPLVEGSPTYQKLKASHSKKGQAPILWFVDGTEGKRTLIYVGEDHPDHTVRLATLRIQKSGKVEVMNYDKNGEIFWVHETKTTSVSKHHPR